MAAVRIKKHVILKYHLKDLDLHYEPGDSLGIYPENDPELVELLLKEIKWNPEEMVTVNKQGEVLPLKEALTSHFEITILTKSLLEKAAQLSANEDLQELVSQEMKNN